MSDSRVAELALAWDAQQILQDIEEISIEGLWSDAELQRLQDSLDLTAFEAIAHPYWQSVQTILPRITTPLLIESAVWHEVGCYAGTVDLVANFDEQPVILDWKTATKPKNPEYLDRYPLQLTAYCGCINRMYGAPG